ncbi:hypothetical protein CHRY9390_02397 [Chryseobacterium aquaeductus]|uniref:Lipoprotein n=1 Tax=Chryseobacterium aquaeductus TaxID=2675056 RepID=A0A9N8MIA6_9FLAO|nr:hypothetical protein [Chryseobacterium aquaeductus]CAA7331683.1 hypothetical protein CHRY9390_02397 [Chryseobacterium potabilaquae]CAD7811677.1 hypothetical protein CHRY9390_02397 [Chryseobacterium aquaeductus]
MKYIIIGLLSLSIFFSCSKKEIEQEKLPEIISVSKGKVENLGGSIFPDFILLNRSDFEKYKNGNNSKWFINGNDKLFFIPSEDYSIKALLLTNKKNTDRGLISFFNIYNINFKDEKNAIKLKNIETDKKIRLGVSKEYVENIFGDPDFPVKNVDGFEIMYWSFTMSDDRKDYMTNHLTPTIIRGKGFSVEMTFEKNKLINLMYAYDVY